MSNTETHSPVVDCAEPAEYDPEHVQLVGPKDVQPGGEDARKVRRTLPSLRRSFVGACASSQDVQEVEVGTLDPGLRPWAA